MADIKTEVVSPEGATKVIELSGQQHRRVILASTLGTVIEWYDFTLYAVASALIFGPQFFPGAGPVGAILASFGTFAIGLAVRPLGGIFFAHFGDRIGRKPIMLATVLVMGLSTTLIGVLPTAAVIGPAAAWLLTLMRVLQGLAVGAEFAGAITLLNETSPTKRRGFSSGFAAAANYTGTTIATVTFTLLSLLPKDVFEGWAWRIPFLATIVVVAVAVYVRTRIEETPAFEQARVEQKIRRLPLSRVFRERPREILSVAAIFCFIIPSSYTIQTFGLNYMTNDLHVALPTATICLVIAYLCLIPSMVLCGMIVDKIGAKKALLIGAIGCIVWAFPVFLLINTKEPVLVTIGIIVSLILSQGFPSAASIVTVTKAFNTEYRWTGIIVSREIPAAAIGGTAPLIAVGLLLLGNGATSYISLFLMAISVLGLIGVFTMPKHVFARPKVEAISTD